ncbi:5-deoxyglucuronate isomerase [Intrasporangium oryzae NRRL B-24470]|uniref:5-deoxyglucuronate isomerase n=1 Tax=Intrasporangium oryzae NRRL B-24470 TaxID=1386089 RepID=W9GAE5_9MICO|nr:5-deoxy-glucuronate isomerase [Intrasporangium oryzae]EWT02202.1 5-deoxyglucuronate isomerase [Intrasporangium oryzae NRRL B-24470]
MSDNARYVRPLASASTPEWEVAIDASLDGWEHTSLYAVHLAPGESRTLAPDEWEHVVVPLAGSVEVTAVDADGTKHDAVLAGRASVFAGPTDVAYAARGSEVTVTATAGPAHVAVCGARATGRHTPPFRHVGAADVPVELRGAGQASREVRNFATPGVLEAESIIACEVITPGGNWSSYPPHKHDEDRPGVEAHLEEIYFFEVQREAGAPDGPGLDPVGYQRVYGTDERPIDVLAEVRSGDVVLVPHGWHGPAMAAPGYDLYYLNVMAGPGEERAWLICDDPAHGWVRDTWSAQPVDPRLPLGGTR